MMCDARTICGVLQRELGEAALARCRTDGVLFVYDHDAARGGDQRSLEKHAGLLGALIKICPTLLFTKGVLKQALVELDIGAGQKLSTGHTGWLAAEGYKLKSMCMLLKRMKRQAKTGERHAFWKQLLLNAMMSSPASPKRSPAAEETPQPAAVRTAAQWVRTPAAEAQNEMEAWDMLNLPGNPLGRPLLVSSPTPVQSAAPVRAGGADIVQFIFSLDVAKKQMSRTTKDGSAELSSTMRKGDATIVAEWADGSSHITDLPNILISVWDQQVAGTTPLLPIATPRKKTQRKAVSGSKRSKAKRASKRREDTSETEGEEEGNAADMKVDAEIKSLLKNANSRGYHRVFSATGNKKLARDAGKKEKRKLARSIGLSCSDSEADLNIE